MQLVIFCGPICCQILQLTTGQFSQFTAFCFFFWEFEDLLDYLKYVPARTVTHPSTNPARRTVTSLIGLVGKMVVWSTVSADIVSGEF